MHSILITGASRGVGRALAIACAASGRYDKMILTCLENSEALAETVRLASQAGPVRCIPSLGDVADLRYVEQLRRDLGPVDTLINNAAVSWVGLLTDMTPAQWDRLIAVNLTGVYNVCHTYVPDLVSAKAGRILNVSSVWGLAGASCEVAYSASKGAVNALTRALAKELAPSHIQVNAVALGIIDTDMNRALSPEEKEKIREDIPAGYIASPEEAAAAMVRLLDMPEYFSGEIVRLDGCWL